MGWLDAAFQVGVPMLAGRAEGQTQGRLLQRQLQQEDEDRRRQQEQDGMRMQLLQAQLQHTTAEEARAASPRPPWAAEGFGSQGDQLTYEEALARAQHPERYQRPEAGSDTPWAKAGFPDQPSYLDFLGKQSRATNPQRFEKPAGAGGEGDPAFDPHDPKNHQKFLTAYLMRTGGGHQDPQTLQWVPAAAPEERMHDAEAAYQEMARLTDPAYNPADDVPAQDDPTAPPDGFTLPGLLNANGFGPPPAGPVAGAPVPPPAPPRDTPPTLPPQPGQAAPPDQRPPVRQPGMSVGARVQQLKAQGVSKEDGFRILQEEGYLDQQGNVITGER